jgi:hypothetical protein
MHQQGERTLFHCRVPHIVTERDLYHIGIEVFHTLSLRRTTGAMSRRRAGSPPIERPLVIPNFFIVAVKFWLA